MLIFHIATAADWAAARAGGAYTTSTRGRTLEEEGFIHAARAEQWRGVHARYYADVDEPLVLLEIDTDRLRSDVVQEPAVPGGAETFPHVYGPIEPSAVLRAVPVRDALAATSFSALFLRELMRAALLGLLVVALAAAGALLLDGTLGGWGVLVGAVAGAGLGVAVAVALGRRDARARRG
ncbi:hypothetical protein NOK12_24710 [Nocardioides sp. OK12]|uniref:DUF952 domain-containing protein n=1 Tax=Nocardioides sp. OK12 TaxID=2758661 RepID=UPI0021C30415|nr:DUF952 domain-containing protein [Nocardioides sp. OK12]GHJ59953.1 hypothetical protein NOK12_24710 [Nocardioides sp. OK12]